LTIPKAKLETYVLKLKSGTILTRHFYPF
jgi:hypothetical protein